jgi:RimJ/RimL family protein N-acetyltransferase
MINPVLLDLPASLETERLLLRPPQSGDGLQVLEAVKESLPELRRFLASMPWAAGEQTPESSETYCRTAQANFLARKDLPFLLFEKRTGELVGAAGLHRMVWETPKAEVGFWGRTSRAGHGFVGEAVLALTRYAFSHLRAVRVELITDEENRRARKLAERCEFRLEGILRNERKAPDGTLRNTCVYARLSPVPDHSSSRSPAA